MITTRVAIINVSAIHHHGVLLLHSWIFYCCIIWILHINSLWQGTSQLIMLLIIGLLAHTMWCTTCIMLCACPAHRLECSCSTGPYALLKFPISLSSLSNISTTALTIIIDITTAVNIFIIIILFIASSMPYTIGVITVYLTCFIIIISFLQADIWVR